MKSKGTQWRSEKNEQARCISPSAPDQTLGEPLLETVTRFCSPIAKLGASPTACEDVRQARGRTANRRKLTRMSVFYSRLFVLNRGYPSIFESTARGRAVWIVGSESGGTPLPFARQCAATRRRHHIFTAPLISDSTGLRPVRKGGNGLTCFGVCGSLMPT